MQTQQRFKESSGRTSHRNERKHFLFKVLFLTVVVFMQGCRPAALPATVSGQRGDTPAISDEPSTAEPTRPAPTAEATQTIQPATVEPIKTTPSPQPTATVELPELKAELFAFFGGGGPSCASDPPQSEAPEIEILSHSFPAPAQDTILCLFNFPLDAEVTVEMLDPSGRTVEQIPYRVGNQSYRDGNTVVQEFSLLEIPISLPLTLPAGTWEIRASSNGEQAAASFLIGTYDPVTPEFSPGSPFITHSPILPAEEITPLNPRLRTPYQPGDTVRVQGMNFGPEMQFRAGLYQGWDNLSLVDSFVVATDSQGSFTHDLLLGADLPSGNYSIMPSTFITEDEESDNSYVNNDYYARFSIQNEPTRTMVGFDCTAETSLVVAGTAYLADDQANNLRLSPGAEGLRIGRLQPGERMVILDGPYCADGLLWWNVHSQDTNLVGWTAEGDEQETWLLPVP